MSEYEPFLELLRWGFVQIPAMLYAYAVELDLDIEDLGIFGAVFYAFTLRSKPLFMTGVEVGQVMQVCPFLSKGRLARRLAKWEKLGLIRIEASSHTEFAARRLHLEPLYLRLKDILLRDHPELRDSRKAVQGMLFTEQMRQLQEPKMAEEQDRQVQMPVDIRPSPDLNGYRRVVDFMAKKTGNLVSLKTANEIKKWLYEYSFQPQFVLCMLELCFERGISHPREIGKIAAGLRECSINSLEDMERYFREQVDGKTLNFTPEFDPEVHEFGLLTGIDMRAEGRRKIYYKWRYDWGFSRDLVKKAGELMCSRTKSGGMEYVDSILASWKEKGISTLEEVEEELKKHKSQKQQKGTRKDKAKKGEEEEREIYLPPSLKRQNAVSGDGKAI